MKREIKFRAWDTSDKPPYMLGPYHLADAIFNMKEVRKLHLMQFTGLHDKNGKEIYEGDVVTIGATDFDAIINEKGYPVAYEVKHYSTDYVLYRNDLKLQWGRLSRLIEMNWYCEVIGNIYENPELSNPTQL